MDLVRFKRWKRLATSNEISYIPANPFQVAVYLQCLLNEFSLTYTNCSVQHRLSNAVSRVAENYRSSHRILGSFTVKKEPVSSEMLKTLVKARITDKSPSVLNLRMVALCLISYAGFFRFSVLSSIKACDVKFFRLMFLDEMAYLSHAILLEQKLSLEREEMIT